MVHYICTRVGMYVTLLLYMYISTQACGLHYSAALDIQVRELLVVVCNISWFIFRPSIKLPWYYLKLK